MIRQCEMCNEEQDCRPYGRNGQWICIRCGLSSDEMVDTVEQNFLRMMEEASPSDGPYRAIILTERGPEAAPDDSDTIGTTRIQ